MSYHFCKNEKKNKPCVFIVSTDMKNKWKNVKQQTIRHGFL